MKAEQIKAILEHFKGKPVNNNVLKEYCNLKHFDVIVGSQYDDAVFQQGHDERLAEVLPFIFAELSQYRDIPTYGSDSDRKNIKEANEDIEWKIAKVLEDHGVLKMEVKIITGGLGDIFKNIMDNAGTRATNMADTVLNTIAKEKFGDPVALRPLGEYYRTKAKDLGVKLHRTQENGIVG